MTHIAVLGAGITGVTAAYRLHEMGYDVTVIDRHRYPAMETSFANGGQLSASNAEVWNSWATVLKGMKWAFRKDAPLCVRWTPSWHKLSWMVEFMAAIPRYEANTEATARLAIKARPLMDEMAERAGLSFDRSPCGILHFYESEKAMAAARRVNAIYAAAGLPRRELSAEEVHVAEPNLVADTVGGFITESDSTGDIHLFTVGLSRWLESQGVAFALGQDVTEVRAAEAGVEVERGGRTERFDAIVVSAGVASRDFAAQLGDRLNVYPVKGYSITVMLPDETSRAGAPRVSLLDDAAKIVTSRLGEGRFRVAGTAEFAGMNRDIRADRVAPLVKWVERHFPDVNTESCVPWAGLRPMMPDMMPRVGRGTHPRVFYNTGHGHLGWTLSAATAAGLAASVAAELPPEAKAVPLAA